MTNDTFQRPSDATHPYFGFWGERDVSWLHLQTNLGGGWAEPLTYDGYARITAEALEQRGTILGMFNDESTGGTGHVMYVAFGYAAGEFPSDAWAQSINDDPVTPGAITTIGNNTVLQEITYQLASMVAKSASLATAGVYISVTDGFAALVPSTTPVSTLGAIVT